MKTGSFTKWGTWLGAVVALSLAVAGCGGGGSSSSGGGGDDDGGGSGGGGTDVEALLIGSQLSLVDAGDTDAAANNQVESSLTSRIHYAVPTSGAYVTDETQVYTYDESMESLDLVNEILCMIDQTNYGDHVNAGPYVALVDAKRCESRSEDHSSESDDQSSGSDGGMDLERWVLDVTRESNTSPQVAEVWVSGTDEEEGFSETFEINARMTIEEAASESNPFGIFTIEFSDTISGTDFSETGLGKIAVSLTDAGDINIEMVEDFGNSFSERVHANLLRDSDSGVAYMVRQVPEGFFGGEGEGEGEGESAMGGGGLIEEVVQVAYDSEHYLAQFGRDDHSSSKCLARNIFDNLVWEYNLYNGGDGSLVDLNGGMGIKLPEGGDHGWGWADYYGIWFGPETDIVDGMAVVSHDDSANYTVFVGGGRFIKHTRDDITLGDLEGDDLMWWDNESGQNFIVEWNGTSLVKIGSDTCDEMGCTRTTFAAPQAIGIEPNDWIGFYKEGVGSMDLIVPESGDLNGDIPVQSYIEEQQTPASALFSDGEVTLYCYHACLRPNLTAEQLMTGDVYLEFREDVNNPHVYSFDPETFSLTLNGEPVRLADGEEWPTDGAYGWGVNNGPLLTADALGGLEGTWQVWQQETRYSYETGPNPWNSYRALVDANGAPVVFDRPKVCEYRDDTYGTFRLQYPGKGQLWGIPWNKIESSDDTRNFEMWSPLFSIPTGSPVECEGATLYVKQMNVQQSMQEQDASECSGLALGNITATTLEPTDPELGDEPTLEDDTPAVIAGENQ